MSAEAADLVRQALRDEASGLDRMTIPRLCVVKLFARIERLSGQIDEAFTGQPFMPHLPPDAPLNVRRCKTYLQLHQGNTKLLEHAIRLWMLTYGMKPEDDWSPIVAEHMRLQYADRQNRPAASVREPARGDDSPQPATRPSPGEMQGTERESHV